MTWQELKDSGVTLEKIDNAGIAWDDLDKMDAKKALYKCNPQKAVDCNKRICKQNANATYPVCGLTSHVEWAALEECKTIVTEKKPIYKTCCTFLNVLRVKADKPNCHKQWVGFWIAILSMCIMFLPAAIGPKYLSPFWAAIAIIVGSCGLWVGMTIVDSQ